MAPGDFNFGGFDATYASPTISAFPDNHLASLQPIQPNPQAYHQQQQPGYGPGGQRVAAAGDKHNTD